MSTKKNDEMRAKLLLKPKTEDAIAALQKDPDNGELWYAYAMSLKDGEAAIDAFCEGLIRNPFMPYSILAAVARTFQRGATAVLFRTLPCPSVLIRKSILSGTIAQ